MKHRSCLTFIWIYSLFFTLIAQAELNDATDSINVDQLKEKYWNQGESTNIGVVQNRAFSKNQRFELGMISGTTIGDPFLNISSIGASAGYHLSESFSLHALAWHYPVSPSSALQTFEEFREATANTNEPELYYGAEADYSILYGKLSLLGKKIIYYDFHFLGGLGRTHTESGRSITPSIGLGQRFFISKNFSLRVDYRAMVYNEEIIEKTIPTQLGEVIGERTSWNHALTIGINFLFSIH